MSEEKRNIKARVFVAFTLLVVASYIVQVIRGKIPKEQRLGTSEIALVALASIGSFAVLRPDILSRLTSLKMAGMEVALLQEVAEKQEKTDQELTDIKLLLPLLLPEKERVHLRVLATGAGAGYIGSNSLRTELRHLASVALISRKPDRAIEAITDGMRFRLGDYVELTEAGRAWVQRLADIDDKGKSIS